MRYTRTAIILHWLTAVLVLGLLTVGLYMTEMSISPLKLKIYLWHKSVGLTVLALILFRLIWRWRNPPPPLLSSLPAWQKVASGFSHAFLYLLLLAMPLSGWLMNSASGFPTKLFSWLPLPNLIAKSSDAFVRWQIVHTALAYLLIGFIALHILAALKHHFIDQDNVLVRMWPSLDRNRRPRFTTPK